ncbi:MAG: hypothetical protein NT062_04630, partial [Proteobacteria bacterium]|nr:hypothetical protein [Pseudomonadota bacterium]
MRWTTLATFSLRRWMSSWKFARMKSLSSPWLQGRRCPSALLHHRAERQVVGLALEQPPERQHLVQRDAEREHVDAPIDLPAAQLLRRHVGVLALDRPGLRLRRILDLRDPEIEDLGDAALGEEHVRRGEVAMHDAERLAATIAQLVSVVDPVAHLLDHAPDHAEVERGRRLRRPAEQRQEREALEVLHDDVELAVGLAQLVHLTDVGVRHLRGDAGLGDEHLADPRVVREVREDALDDVELLEARGAFEPREEDLPHAAGREAGEQLVAAEPRRSLGDRRSHPCENHSIR